MITAHSFGCTAAGLPVTRFRLRNGRGAHADILDYGGTIQSLCLPGRDGGLVDVALGYDHIEGYEAGGAYFGATLGRYANRLCGAKYTLGGQAVAVSANEGDKCLHGGFRGFNKHRWQAETQRDALVLRRLSPSGEEGFLGDLAVQIAYTLTEDNALHIRYRARASAPTVVSLSNHCYFNLKGQGQGTVLDHQVEILADGYTEADGAMHTTGRIMPLGGTALDFTSPKPLGRDIGDPMLSPTQGFDHNFVLRGRGFCRAAGAYCPATGLAMALYTDAPGMQLYTANFLSDTGKGGAAYVPYGAFCMEAQSFPDAPNHPHFPSAALWPGEVYERETACAFMLAEAFPRGQ